MSQALPLRAERFSGIHYSVHVEGTMAIEPIREPLPEPPGFDRHMVWKVPFATAACCPSKVNRESVPVPWFAANSSPQGAMA